MRLAVIPARGGSKPIPRKNIRESAGLPMIAHAIDAARSSGLFDHVLVSTDDAEIAQIAQIAQSHGAEVPFKRPPELADDHTPTVPVIAHAIQGSRAFGWSVDHACCIYPGVPLIQADDIAAALALLDSAGGAGYTFPVTPFPSAIQRALRRAPDDRVAQFHPEFVNTRTQDLKLAFHDADQFYWGLADTWLAGLAIHANARTIVLPEWRVVDIDTETDWERAELMYQTLLRNMTK